MKEKLRTELQRAAVDEAIQLNPSFGNREIQRLLVSNGTPTSHVYVGNRKKVLGIPASSKPNSRFKGRDAPIINVSSAKSEKEIEDAVAELHRKLNPLIEVKTQVQIIVGRADVACADILIDGAVFEVKLLLERESLFKALGQVLIYQSLLGDLNKSGSIVAGGYASAEHVLIDQVTKLGVNVFLWDDEQLIPWGEEILHRLGSSC